VGHSGAHNKGIHWFFWDKNDGGMGFKNLSVFNLAMSGKQSWCIWTSPDTLIVRLYKARYFPKCSFLDSLVLAITRLLSGGVFATPNLFSEQVIGGELVMVTTFHCGMRIS
jgi:hypothetical protein